MSDIINFSLDISPLNKTLLNAGVSDPFKAKVYPTPIPFAKIQIPVLANGSLGYGSTVRIDFPRSGNNILSYLKVNLSGEVSNLVSGVEQFVVKLGFAGIIYLFKSIKLFQGDVLIETILPEDTLARILSDSSNARQANLNAVGSTLSYPFGNLFYPLYFSCFEQLKNSIDTKVLQQFTLVLELANSIYDIAYTPSANVTISTTKILDYQDNTWAIGFYSDDSVRTILASDPRSLVQYVTYGNVVIGGTNYLKVSIYSVCQLKYFTPFGLRNSIYYWYINQDVIPYVPVLSYSNESDQVPVPVTVSIVGVVYFTKIPGELVSYTPNVFSGSPIYPPPNVNSVSSIDNIIPTLIELENVVTVVQQPNQFQQEKEQFKTLEPLLTLLNSNEKEIDFSNFTKNVNDNVIVGPQPPATKFSIFSVTYQKYLGVTFGTNPLPVTLSTSIVNEQNYFYMNFLTTSSSGLVSCSLNAFDVSFGDYYQLELDDATSTYLNYDPEVQPPIGSNFNLIPTENGLMLKEIATGKFLYWNNNLSQPFTTTQPSGINPEIFLIEPYTPIDTLTFEVPINIRKLVHSTRFMVKQLTDLSVINKTPLATANIPIDGHYVAIDSVEFYVDNELVWIKSSSEFNAMTNRDYNKIRTNWNNNNTLDNIFTHENGLTVSLTENSGAINFNYLTDAKFKVRCKDLSFGKYKLTVLHNIWNEFSVDGSDGKMQLVHDY